MELKSTSLSHCEGSHGVNGVKMSGRDYISVTMSVNVITNCACYVATDALCLPKGRVNGMERPYEWNGKELLNIL